MEYIHLSCGITAIAVLYIILLSLFMDIDLSLHPPMPTRYMPPSPRGHRRSVVALTTPIGERWSGTSPPPPSPPKNSTRALRCGIRGAATSPRKRGTWSVCAPCQHQQNLPLVKIIPKPPPHARIKVYTIDIVEEV